MDATLVPAPAAGAAAGTAGATTLMRTLVGRWDHQVTTLIGGAGLGKTTVLTQAVAENRLAPRGQDLWVGLDPRDADAERLAQPVAAALSPPTSATPVAEALWQRSPNEICLIFDDVHHLPAGCRGAQWLVELIEALPVNAHVVLASRAEPSIPLSRLESQGAVLRLGQDDLRFSADELAAAMARRDRSGAHRMLGHCIDALEELGAEPSSATCQLRRRVLGVAV